MPRISIPHQDENMFHGKRMYYTQIKFVLTESQKISATKMYHRVKLTKQTENIPSGKL